LKFDILVLENLTLSFTIGGWSWVLIPTGVS
jgi:hypothetical protein